MRGLTVVTLLIFLSCEKPGVGKYPVQDVEPLQKRITHQTILTMLPTTTKEIWYGNSKAARSSHFATSHSEKFIHIVSRASGVEFLSDDCFATLAERSDEIWTFKYITSGNTHSSIVVRPPAATIQCNTREDVVLSNFLDGTIISTKGGALKTVQRIGLPTEMQEISRLASSHNSIIWRVANKLLGLYEGDDKGVNWFSADLSGKKIELKVRDTPASPETIEPLYDFWKMAINMVQSGQPEELKTVFEKLALEKSNNHVSVSLTLSKNEAEQLADLMGN